MEAYLHGFKSWWDFVHESKAWQDVIYYALAGTYGLVSIFALVQLIQIQFRVPEYGWTTQKVFHLLNILFSGLRAAVFVFRREVQFLRPQIIQYVLLDFPGLLFFTTYTLLVLFWAEVYYQARNTSSENVRLKFIVINGVFYAFQILIWLFLWWRPSTMLDSFSHIVFAGAYFLAGISFLLYGGRLFLMLRRFPVGSRGREKKLREVGGVAAICFICFTIRSIIMAWSAFDKQLDLDVLDHPILNAMLYLLVEIAPSALVLYTLRTLPPKRFSNLYQPIS